MSFLETENAAQFGEAVVLGQSSGVIEKGQYIEFGRYPRYVDGKETHYYYEESYSEDNSSGLAWIRKDALARIYYCTPSVFKPIQWLVLETDGQTALLVSRYVIDKKIYDACDCTPDREYEDKASLALFLNEDFMAISFTEEEKQRIVPCKIRIEDYKCIGSDRNKCDIGQINIFGDIFAVNGTFIKVQHIFSLSLKEVFHYFNDTESRKCRLFENGKAESYWLRDAGKEPEKRHKRGFVIDEFGSLRLERTDECLGIRPVMRIVL